MAPCDSNFGRSPRRGALRPPCVGAGAPRRLSTGAHRRGGARGGGAPPPRAPPRRWAPVLSRRGAPAPTHGGRSAPRRGLLPKLLSQGAIVFAERQQLTALLFHQLVRDVPLPLDPLVVLEPIARKPEGQPPADGLHLDLLGQPPGAVVHVEENAPERGCADGTDDLPVLANAHHKIEEEDALDRPAKPRYVVVVRGVPLVALVDPIEDVQGAVAADGQHIKHGDWPHSRCPVAHDVLRHQSEGLEKLGVRPQLLSEAVAGRENVGHRGRGEHQRHQVARV
mmetsp:Transcript_38726/g.109509  ORF Transcript_38726/g.109509 Transcript_38726/m.109509 type:complete len:281 (+) Transcript_38726:957-1799(+)